MSYTHDAKVELVASDSGPMIGYQSEFATHLVAEHANALGSLVAAAEELRDWPVNLTASRLVAAADTLNHNVAHMLGATKKQLEATLAASYDEVIGIPIDDDLVPFNSGSMPKLRTLLETQNDDPERSWHTRQALDYPAYLVAHREFPEVFDAQLEKAKSGEPLDLVPQGRRYSTSTPSVSSAIAASLDGALLEAADVTFGESVPGNRRVELVVDNLASCPESSRVIKAVIGIGGYDPRA